MWKGKKQVEKIRSGTKKINGFLSGTKIEDILKKTELTLTDLNESIDCNEITGDVNNDYLTNVVDIVSVVSNILNPSEFDICQNLSSDMDFNSELNVIDIVSLIELILEN